MLSMSCPFVDVACYLIILCVSKNFSMFLLLMMKNNLTSNFKPKSKSEVLVIIKVKRHVRVRRTKMIRTVYMGTTQPRPKLLKLISLKKSKAVH